MRKPLNTDELVVVLDGWAGKPVAVRVVASGNQLIAVFRGRLGNRTTEKHPALFWPLTNGARGPTDAEEPGVYLHPDAFRGAAIHEGSFVVEWRQGDVVVNLRLV